MTKKKPGKGKARKITVTATPREYAESGACCGMLALWACSAFDLPATAENARAMYRLAWSRAGEHMAVNDFTENPIG